MTKESDWAWLAGFYDGEGHCSCRDRTGNSHLPKYRSPRSIVLCINQHHPEVLQRCIEITQSGVFYQITKTRPSYSKLKGQYTSYSWRCGARNDVLFVLSGIWPWVGSVKKAQAALAVKRHTELDPKQLDVIPGFIIDWLRINEEKER